MLWSIISFVSLRTLWIASGPILSHDLCAYFPYVETDKVNGCILAMFRRAKMVCGPQLTDSPRLRHWRSAPSPPSRCARPKRGTPWTPSPPTSLSRHHSPSFSPEDNCKISTSSWNGWSWDHPNPVPPLTNLNSPGHLWADGKSFPKRGKLTACALGKGGGLTNTKTESALRRF